MRSGVTPERLPAPLTLPWVFRSPAPPARGWAEPEEAEVWSYGVTRVGRVRYDDAFQVAAVGDLVYFASSAENTVYAVDAVRGTVRWTFVTTAPPRLAPAVADGRIYFGADDGVVYCLDAADGRLLWRFQAAPTAETVIGQGKLISLWPVRTGVLVDGGTAYFAAGLFPAEGLYLVALDAATGKLLWRNDSFDRGGNGRLSPQGYLLASADRLVVPSGRISPGVFSRRDGRLLFEVQSGWGLIGGSYAMLAGDRLYNGTQQVIAYDLDEGKQIYSWFGGRRVVVDGPIAYLVTDAQMLAVPQAAMPEACKQVDRLRETFWSNRNELRAYQRAEQELAALEPEDPRRQRLQQDLTRRQPARDAYQEVAKEVDAELDRACRWRIDCRAPDALILAGGVLVAGGDGNVTAVDARTGRRLWNHAVEGNARGLAVANGRLLVSTTAGSIYCFTAATAAAAATAADEPRQVLPPSRAKPFANDPLSPFYARVADDILTRAGLGRGYCLIVGGGTGRLAYELASRSELFVYVVDADRDRVARARNTLRSTGIYGSRIVVNHGSLGALALPPYFANLVVCEEGFLGDEMSTPAGELLRVLRPCGGKAFAGQPRGGEQPGRRLPAERVRQWLQDLPDRSVEVQVDGAWATLTRGKLDGAADWTHQYADAGNTASSGDRLARAPFGVLWFGDPGPRPMIERHARPPAPLALDGRMFILGRHQVICHDAYNGLPLWRRELPGSWREGLPMEAGSMAAAGDSLFVLVGDECLRLDTATGETRQTYAVPPRDDGQPRRWGWIAADGKRLFGTRTQNASPYKGWPEPRYHDSECVFALDAESGSLLWKYEGRDIMNVSLAVDGGRVFLLDKAMSDLQRRQAVEECIRDPGEEEAPVPFDRKGQPVGRDLRLAVALDAATGKPRWVKPLDVTDCVVGPGSRPVAGGEISLIAKDGVLLLVSAPWNGHFLKEFQAGKFSRRSIIALDAGSGRLLWSGHKGYRSRPLVVGDTIYAEPWAHDLRTGRPRQRVSPITGQTEKWQMWRGYGGCGTVAASAHTLLFRSGTVGYCDLERDDGVRHFGGMRPGCWINFIAAAGLVLVPEGSSECVCPLAVQCSLALVPRTTDRAWGQSSAWKPLLPAKHLAVNLGAPGDRRDAQGTLWLAWPRKGMIGSDLGDWLAYWGPLEKFYHHRAEVMPIAATDRPWLFTSGCRGLEELAFPLRPKGQPPARYTVRLLFAEPELAEPGRRVFDVTLQGNNVLTDFDVVAASGGGRQAITREFRGIEVTDSLRVRLTPSEASGKHPPILSALEAVIESD